MYTTMLITLHFGLILTENKLDGHGTINLTLNPDGSYSFSYSTDAGGFHGSKKEVSGNYGFGDSDASLGVEFSEEILSNDNGNGGGLSAPRSSGNGNGYGENGKGGGDGASRYGTNKIVNMGMLRLKLNADSSYSYSYDLKEQGKSENRNADPKVIGNYYRGTDGQRRNVDYITGVGGFQRSGDGIETNGTPVANEDEDNYSVDGGASDDLKDDDIGLLTLNLGLRGVYSYNYALKSEAENESRTANGKIRGKFYFITPSNERKSIQYTADEGGFQPQDDYILNTGIDDGNADGVSNSRSRGDYSFEYNTEKIW